ncbi:MAG: Calx-beta domain-containing protein [Verrucomicrobiota bacterium]|jgi:uncharacterized delta-60 repeat protein/uncharacterized repeat protein (TIGR01451 family)
MQNETNLRRAGRSLAPRWLLAVFFGVLVDAHAQLPPANDNMTNAQVLLGLSGTVTGNNVLATLEVGEPAPVAGVASAASIWYLWTAPSTNWMDFDTHNSTDTNYNTLDTVMAVYSLNGPLRYGSLTKVASNDDDPNAAAWPLVSRVNFLAIPGTTYLIQLEGKIVNGVTNEGNIVLDWSPSVFAGIFSFSTNAFVFGSEDNALLSANNTITPTLMNTAGGVTNIGSTANSGECRVTIKRSGGYNGRVQVDMLVTNDYYENQYKTNMWATNIYFETVDLNYNLLLSAGWTNYFFTNMDLTYILQYDTNGILSTYYLTNWVTIIGTNLYNPATIPPLTTTITISNTYNSNVPPVDITGFLTNITATNFDATGTNPVSYVLAVTNLTFANPPTAIVYVPSAKNGVDYRATDYQTVTFDDYQMSKDVFINVLPTSPSPTGPDYPDPFGNLLAPGISRRVILVLTNARLDPLESLDVAAPLVAPNNLPSVGVGLYANTGVAVAGIEDFYAPPVLMGQPIPGTNYELVNFIRRTFRCNKPKLLSTNTTVSIPVERYNLGTDVGALTVEYVINAHYPLGASDTSWTQAASLSGLEAGADNAIGQVNGFTFPLGNYDFTVPYAGHFGTITWGPGQSGFQNITITNNNNGAVEFDMEYSISLYIPPDPYDSTPETTPAQIGNIGTANVIIQFDQRDTQQQPGGAADRDWNQNGLASSFPPFNPLPGADNEVLGIAVQADGGAVIGGHFQAYDSTNFNYLVRALPTGLPDFSFNSGVGIIGPNDFVAAVVIDANGKILIAGNFTSFNGVTANRVARLNSDGSLDTSFNTGRGADGTVWALALDPNGNVVIGGDFLTFNSTNRVHIARLLPTGSLDTSFDPGSGTDQNFDGVGVRTVAADSLGDVVIGGAFSYVNGTNWPGLARLLPSGALDTNFNPGTDVHGTVYGVAVQSPGNQIVIGGNFSVVGLTNVPCIARLNYNGSVDNSFAPGAGVNGPVYCVAIQPSDQKILIGGQFTSVGTVRRVGYARLLPNGWVDTSFMDTSYNQFAGLINHYNNPFAVNPNDLPIPTTYNTPNYVKAMAVEPSGNIMIGGSFARLGGGVRRDDVNLRWNVASIIGAPTLGPQGTGGGLGNYPGNMTFTQSTYTGENHIPSASVTVARVDGSLGRINIMLASNTLPAGPGAAGAADFGLINNGYIQYPASGLIIVSENGMNGYGWRAGDGLYGPNNLTELGGGSVPLLLSIATSTTKQGPNLTSGLSLSVNDLDTFNLGGMTIPTYPAPGTTLASLEIINDNFPAGTFGFSQTNYNVLESAGNATITVLRTNGSYGGINLSYQTRNGYTNDPGVQSAIGGRDYGSITSGTLTFSDEQVSASFQVPITNFSTLQSNKFFNVVLTKVSTPGNFDTNNPPLLVTNAVVTIVDNHFQPGHLSFNSAAYSVTKGGTASIGIQRTGGALGIVSVACLTSDLTASNGINYTTVSNYLTWTNGDVSVKTVSIPTIEDHVVEGTKSFAVYLTNAYVPPVGNGGQTNNSLVLIYPSSAVVNIADDDFYGQLNLAPTNINVLQNAGQVLVTVARTGGTVGTISVNYATANGSGLIPPLQPAQAGTNYGATNGTLIFGDGVTSQTFTVPIYYTPTESNAANRVISLTLSNPNPPAITNGNPFPKTGTITILDPQLVTGSPGSVDTTLGTGVGFNNVVNSLSLQPDGKILAGGLFTYVNYFPVNQVARLNADGSVDGSFLYQQAGSDGQVQAVLSQTPDAGQVNGSIMVAGSFAHFDEIPFNNIARLNLDGSLDTTFNPGAGADNTVYTVVETFLAPVTNNGTPMRAYLIGGSFANFNGVQRSGVARLIGVFPNAGQVDLNFNPGNGVTSTNGAVHALAVQGDGKVLVGGDFTSFNNVSYHHLVRLKLDGSVDPTFNADTGSSVLGSVHAIAIQTDGQIVIGGVFTNVNGVNLNHIARLNPDGSVDASFNVGVGANNTVEALAIDSQGRILAGGQFTRASGVTRNAMTRFNPDGTVDPTINFGAGANGYVHAMAIQGNDEINVGGSFTTFGGYAQNNFTRLFGGAISGPGTLAFTGPIFGAVQNQTNAVVTVQRTGGTGNATFPVVSAVVTTADGTALNGVDYTGVTNTVSFPIGETFTNVLVPVINNGVVGSNRFFTVNLSDPVAASLGFQSSAEVIITNANSAVSFSSSSYRQSENAPGGAAVIPVVRVGNPISTLTVTAYTGTNGTATPGVNYIPVTNVLVFGPGVSTNLWLVPLFNNTNMLSDQTVDLELSNSIGGFLTTPSEATLTIATVYAGPGVVAFDQPSYTVSEGVTNEVINVIRSNGLTGPISVAFATSNGTATAGINYQAVSTVLNFSDGQSSQSVTIPVYQLATASPDTTVLLNLFNPTNTTISGSSVETLTIQNDIQDFYMDSPDYFVSEASGTVTVSIRRNGPTNGTISVGYTTVSPTNAAGTNGYAIPGLNYGPTNGVLTFGPGQTFETVPIAIYQQNTVDAPETFQVVLTNQIGGTNVETPGTQIGIPGAAVVTIIGDVTGFELATNAYITGENGSNVVVTVNRLNVNTGAVSVNFATVNGTAVAGVDYVATNGVLLFADGIASNNVTLTILNPGVLENTKAFNFVLSNPVSTISTNIYLLSPSNAVITITNTITAISFSSAAYAVNEKGVQVQINVLVGGVTNTNTSVQFATADGTGKAGVNYFATNGTLNFAPGVTSQSFTIDVIDDHIITADHTVVLSLSNPEGQGPIAPILSPPSTAILTIQEGDGSYVIAAGTALAYESFRPTNGLIDPGETVTVDFGLRCISGGNTTNLVATLEANSGVTPVVPNAQTYGALAQGGHAVSQPFTFTANGTNSQVISAVFQLQDGPRNLATAVFSFTLGTTTTTFSNPGLISVPATNFVPNPAEGPSGPYPSSIPVSGVAGSVGKVTVTVSNLTHSLPSDIEIVLVSPATNALLMNDVGGAYGVGVTNFTVTFDDAAATYLSSNQLVNNISVTNKPTPYINEYVNVNGNYSNVTLFVGNNWGILPVMPSPAPANPYPTNLAIFSGTAANGTWSLYVADTQAEDYGAISNGWSLNLSTGNPVPSYTDLELSVVPAPATVTVGNNLIYTVGLTNYGPAGATGVFITNIVPAGLTYLSNNFPGTVVNNNGILIFAVNALAVGSGISFNITNVPNAAEIVTNTFIAISDQLEPSTNNVTNVVSVVNQPSADLGVTLNATPNPVTAGDYVTLTLVATNNGPSIAFGTTVTNYLPAGLVVTGNSASMGTVASAGGTNIWSVGDLPAYTNATLTLSTMATSAGGATVLDVVVVGSSVYDPFKLNNFASFKIVINPAPTLSIVLGGRSNTFTWSAAATNYMLQGATNLTPPVVWVTVTNPATVVNGQYSVTVPTNSLHFFKLTTPF